MWSSYLLSALHEWQWHHIWCNNSLPHLIPKILWVTLLYLLYTSMPSHCMSWCVWNILVSPPKVQNERKTQPSKKGYKCLLLVMMNSDLGYASLYKRRTSGNSSNMIFSFFVFGIGPKIAYVYDLEILTKVKSVTFFERATDFWACWYTYLMLAQWGTESCWAEQRGTTACRCYVCQPICNT